MCAFHCDKPSPVPRVPVAQSGQLIPRRLFSWRLGLAVLLAAITAGCTLPKKEPDPVESRPCKIDERIQRCATVPLASQEEEAAAKTFRTPAVGMARIYLSRPYTHEWRKTSEVSIDGRLVGRLAPETFFAIDVTQGLHTVEVRTDVVTTFLIRAGAGQLHYLHYQLDFWLSRYTGKLKPIDAEKAQALLLNMRMAAVLPSS